MADIPKKQPHRKYIPRRRRITTDLDGFYQSRRWRWKRKNYREKKALICEACKYAGEDGVTHPGIAVDHIVPLLQGGDPLHDDNLNMLCDMHHNRKSGMEGHRPVLVESMVNRRGYLVPTDKSEIWQILTKKDMQD